MLKRSEQGQFSIINRIINDKYWFIGSALFFLLAASVYLIFTPVTYKVTTRIAINNNQHPDEIVKNIKSKVLLQKVIDQLPLRVSYYYKKSSKETEIPGDSSPIKFIFSKRTAGDSSAEIRVTILNNRQYKILEDKTYMSFFFNQQVDFYSFAKFKIIKGPVFTTHTKPVTLRINDADQLLEEYYKNLDTKFVDDNHKTIELSLITRSIKKGKNFLDKLVEVYNKSNAVTNGAGKIRINSSGNIQEISDELTILKAKAEMFKDQKSSANEGAINDSISKINFLIKYKQLKYNNLLKNKVEPIGTITTKPIETVIEKSDGDVITYPKTGYVYLFALLIGLALPLAIPYFKLRTNL